MASHRRYLPTSEEEYEINVAAAALSDLSRKKRDQDKTGSQETEVISSKDKKKAKNRGSKRKKTDSADEAKCSQKSKERKEVSRQKRGKGLDKEAGSRTPEDGALTSIKQSSTEVSSLLRGSHHPRLLLPKPASGEVINIPLSVLINRTGFLDPTIVQMKGSVSSESLTTGNESPKKKSLKKSGGKHECPKCGLKTTTRQALWKHKRRKHPLTQEENHQFDNVKCQECDSFSCRSYKALLMHYNKAHLKKLRIQHRQFSSGKEFDDWKKQTERMYGAWFVLSNGLKIYENYTTRYYYCNKSGVSKGKAIRDLKDSSKTNGRCCAYIIKKQDKNSGKVTIEYSLDHVGHTTKMGLSVVTDDVSRIISSANSSGGKVQSLMDEICRTVIRSDCYSSGTVDKDPQSEIRIHIPETQDQMATLTKLMDKLQERQDNPVIIYKPKGDVSFEMSSEDFILGVQTLFQRDMMKKYAKNIVCVNTSQNIPCFKISLMVIDSCGDAVPVGWLLSNKKDRILFKPFLEALRTNCGDLETDILVTNMDSSMYNLWTETFSKPWRKLDCSWYVDDVWRENIFTHVANVEQQLVIYTFLKTLQYEANEITFRKLMQEFLVLLDEVSPGFKQYFTDDFLSHDRCFHWAFCFRTGFLANASQIDDAFHKMVRSFLLANSQTQDVVELFLELLKLSHDGMVEYFTKKVKNGKFLQLEQEMKMNHEKVDEIQEDQWTMKDREWSLMSVNEESIECVVQMITENCQCQLKCGICHVCIHMYNCTCVDFLLSLAGCEHIHAIHMNSEKDTSPLVQPLSIPTEEVEAAAAAVYLTDSTTPIPENPVTNTDENIEQLRSEALEKLKDVEQCLQVTSDLALLTTASDQLRDIAQSFTRDHH
ncbi:Zinc finger transcription factor family protein 17 [Holothuria leucospilota]|uniref:Zinc finger transcription factor family protein 17 n=1 Tax=Holothuria leucospilota TaxID=206669 RepID=A0A9Q1CGQ2_HOLLE|nr:Zinc finger transcription factor family protein 17 [Holothuria leucospilota]